MKLVKLSAVGFILVWLSACSTLGGPGNQDGSLNEDGVIVEDRGTSANGVDGDGVSGSDFGDGAETQVIVGEENFQGDILDDPANALSSRVVYFEYDSSSVRQEDQITLEAHASYLADNPTARVRLEGHTDQRGSREYNLALGERRALAIRQILMIQGASINQFQVTSFGEERPQNEGDSEANWQNNRRVELIYTGR
jgi:peptidoglycan-associated lipoprotein